MNTPQVRTRSFRRAVYRGLSLVAPPLVTIAILIWMATSIRQFFLEPVLHAARAGLVWSLADIRHGLIDPDPATVEVETPDGPFMRVGSNDYVPQLVAQTVQQRLGTAPLPAGREVYRRYVDIRFLKLPLVVPLFLLVFILVLYLFGKFLALRIGRFLVEGFEHGLARLPLVRSVFPAVKQVTSLLLSERETGYTRIVAVEFPSPGTWAIAFVTGESLLQLGDAAAEPVLSLHVPYPPWLKGSVITVRKSQTIELNMTVDQAIQYVMSCGVLRPPHQVRLPETETAAKLDGDGERT